jgi:hypothetical protein
VSEPVAVPEPERAYPWREVRDRDVDTLAVLVSALVLDFDAAVSILETLDNEQTVSLCWCLARWHATELTQHFEDPVTELQRLALVLAHGRGGSA